MKFNVSSFYGQNRKYFFLTGNFSGQKVLTFLTAFNFWHFIYQNKKVLHIPRANAIIITTYADANTNTYATQLQLYMRM